MKDLKTCKQIVQQIAKETKLSEEEVINTYKAYWAFIRHVIESLPLKETFSIEDYKKLRTSVNIPSLGKLACTEEKFTKLLKQTQYLINHDKSKRYSSDVQSDNNNSGEV